MSLQADEAIEVEEIPETGSTTRKGRRPGITVYEKNPFVAGAANGSKIGTKRLSSKDGHRFMIVSGDTGEVVAPAGFHEIIEVDRTQFLKLYANGVSAFAQLNPAGKKVFEVLCNVVFGRPGMDRVWLHFKDIDQKVTPMSPATFKRGMRELLELRFIAESDRPDMYWLNVDFLFNGNRLAFIQEYRLRSTTPRPNDQAARELLEANGQGRLSE